MRCMFPDIWRQQIYIYIYFFVILEHFLPFSQSLHPTTQKIKILKTWQKTWRYHYFAKLYLQSWALLHCINRYFVEEAEWQRGYYWWYSIILYSSTILYKHLHLLHMDKEVKKVFPVTPIVSFKSAQKLSSYLVRAKINPLQRTDHLNVTNPDVNYA